MTLRDSILSKTDRRTEAVEVPEWGVTVHLRELSLAERLRLFDLLSDDGKTAGRHLYVFALLFTLADEHGQRLFSEDDYEALADKSPEVLVRLGKRCAEFNRLIGDPVNDAKKN